MSSTAGVDQAKYQARSVGRTPEEHAALEAMLAERRARRRDLAAASAISVVRAASIHTRARENVRPAPYPLSARPQQYQSVSRPQPQPQPQPQEPPRPSSPPAPAGGGVAEIRAALLRPWGYAGRPPHRPRDCKGAGWHRRGYRAGGCMWINTDQHGCTKGHDYSQDMTLADFVWENSYHQSQSDYCPQGGHQTWDLRFRKKSLRQLLADASSQGLGDGDILLRDLFDGGETVYYRVLDGDVKVVKDDWL